MPRSRMTAYVRRLLERDDPPPPEPLFGGGPNREQLLALALDWADRPEFRDLVDQTRERIAAIDPARAYLGWSGGKDSTALAHLAPGFLPIYGDDDLVYPEHRDFADRTPGLLAVRSRSPQLWYHPWRGRWRLADERPAVSSVVGYAYGLGYRECLLGLRRQEAGYRRDLLNGGYQYVGAAGIANHCPLADWSDRDIWAYIYSRGLDYCRVYDRLGELGVPLRYRRVGPLPLSEGRLIAAAYPEVWADIRTAGLHHGWSDTRIGAAKIVRQYTATEEDRLWASQ